MVIWSAYPVIQIARHAFRRPQNAYPATPIISFRIMCVIITIVPMGNSINKGLAKHATKRSAPTVFIRTQIAPLVLVANTCMRISVRRIVPALFMELK